MDGDRHDDLFERGVAGALADAVHAELDLAGSRPHGGDRVGRRHAEIVLAVEREDRALELGHLGAQVREEIAHLVRQRVADGVGDVDGPGSGREHGPDELRQKRPIGARRVHRRELDVADGAMGARDHAGRELEHVVVVAAELVGELHLAGVDEDVNPGAGGAGHRLGGRVDVARDAAGQPADARRAHLTRHGVNGPELAWATPPGTRPR